MRERPWNEIREIRIIPNFQKKPCGSALIYQGDTAVLCSAQVVESIPEWLKGQGWLTAEYSMLPGATEIRVFRDRGHVNGRSKEIERLIGRALRVAVDLKKLGERTVWIDCDVLQADGGTRTASITAGFVALSLCLRKLLKEGKIKENPIKHQVAAVSVGIVEGKPLLDLSYEEDSKADVDMNVVMTSDMRFVEIQGTAEGEPMSQEQLETLISLAKRGILRILEIQRRVLEDV